jgi:fructose-1,6-bisphosphatase/inositol monophosphatase family enzyme
VKKNQKDYIVEFSKNFAVSAVESIIIRINENLGFDIDQPTFKDINNITRKIDDQIQDLYHTFFRREFGKGIIFAGEEVKNRGTGADWNKKDKFIASIDAVDGTDLVFRGFYNWCTAMFFFLPGEYVFGSVVGTPSSKIGRTLAGGMKEIPSGTIYYANEEAAYKSEPNLDGEFSIITLTIPEENQNKRLKDASLCFYGQKAGNFLSLAQKENFLKKLEQFAEEAQEKKQSIPFRLYNFGGNPMIVKLAEGYVDCVIELNGQKSYDVLPGAFIAQKAGAFWGDLRGNLIDSTYLKKNGFLSDPEKKLSYIIANSKQLYEELLDLVRS